MPANPVSKAAILMVVLVIAAIASWELYLRSKKVNIAYDDGGPLWSDKRAEVYEPADRSTVFIGSSRIKYDLDVPTWENITGEHAILLAIQGSNPCPMLYDLADDKNFKGKLIIDVTEILFFSNAPPNLARPMEYMKYYKDRTPAQRASFEINHALESRFVFLEQDYFSLNAMLDGLHVPSRPGVFIFPDFPLGFHRTAFTRQNIMSDEFLADTNQQNQVKGVWAFLGKISKEPPASGEVLQGILQKVKDATDKIKARGGQIVFVRTPSSGPFLQAENMGFPREKYWDKILEITGSPGIHYADYPALDHFICPEFSHLTPKDAVVFTQNLVKILSEEKGWKFPKTPGSISYNH